MHEKGYHIHETYAERQFLLDTRVDRHALSLKLTEQESIILGGTQNHTKQFAWLNRQQLSTTGVLTLYINPIIVEDDDEAEAEVKCIIADIGKLIDDCTVVEP